MPILRWIAGICTAIFHVAVGERGPDDIVVTRSGGQVRIRLPNRWNSREPWTPLMIGSLVFGPFIVLITISSTLQLPANDQNLQGMAILVVVLLAAMITTFIKWRLIWGHELILTSSDLQIRFRSWGRSSLVSRLDMTLAQQFTVIDPGRGASLVAESLAGPLMVIVADDDPELLKRVGTVLADEVARTAQRPAVPVAIERPFEEPPPDRAEPPLNCKTLLTRHETGVTLDFPLPEDFRIRDRKSAWKMFKISLGIWLASFAWLGICFLLKQEELMRLFALGFLAGIGTLLAAASSAWSGHHNVRPNDDLRQLSVVGDMLIRTTRDHRKQVWYRREVAGIAIDIVYTDEGPNLLQLLLRVPPRPAVILRGPFGDDSASDYRPKAELQWIATQLRNALFEPAAVPTETSRNQVESHGIRGLAIREKETRISS